MTLKDSDKFIDDIIQDILKYGKNEPAHIFTYLVKIKDKDGKEKSLDGLYFMDIENNTLILKEK